jgi:hypothetical protein
VLDWLDSDVKKGFKRTDCGSLDRDIYSARGVWSVAVVWLIGHWFGNAEAQLGGNVFRWRPAGAALMTSAIVLVVSR